MQHPWLAVRGETPRRTEGGEAFGPHGAFVLFAGPCVLEDDDLNLTVARGVQAAAREAGFPVAFKASFDKANRSRLGSHRGPGLARGLEQLARVREATGLPILTDIHEPAQAAPAAEVADILQIPGLSLPPDGASGGGRGNGQGGERQEGPVDVPGGDGWRGGKGPGRRCRAHFRYGTRNGVRLR